MTDAAALTPDLSVIVCTHNPREDYFSRVIRGLRGQTLAMEKWELLVVDNCSATPVAAQFDFSWHPTVRLVREDKLGLTPARLRGIEEAQGALLVLVDDDNVLDPAYLETALRIAEERPFIGAWGGQCVPRFDQPPPEWTRRYWGSLCIREFEFDRWSNMPRLTDTMPSGAGLCVRRAAARHYLDLHESGRRSMLLDRRGGSLLSGGDNDLAACACDLGLGVGLFAALKLKHLIPRQRLELNYLCRLVEGIEFSSFVLDAERGVEPQARGTLGVVADLLRVLRARGPHRQILRAVYRGRDRARSALAAGKRPSRAADKLTVIDRPMEG